MNCSFVRLPGCGRSPCYLLTHLKDGGKEGFSLMLTDGEQVWDGQLTEEDLDAQSGDLKMDFNTYVSQTAKAFTRRDMSDINFIYQLKPQADGIIDLVWKKEVSGDIKIKMGSVTLCLKSNAAETMCQIFASCIDMNTELLSKIRSLETDNQRLSQERQNALKRLDKCVSAKEDLEKDLYSKFVAVLNSKKEKIRSMQNGGGDDAESMDVEPAMPTSDGDPKRKRSKAHTAHVADAADSDDSAVNDKEVAPHSSSDEDAKNTDDETPPKRRRAPPSPRPARGMSGGKLTSSLALGDDEEEDNPSSTARKSREIVKRPARQRGANKRQTPPKPVLPKFTSRSSDTGAKTPQRSSVRKSGSGHSDRSVENLDPDDLLNDF